MGSGVGGWKGVGVMSWVVGCVGPRMSGRRLHRRQPQHLLADALVAPGVALETLAPDADHFDARDETHLQFKVQFGPDALADPAAQRVPVPSQGGGREIQTSFIGRGSRWAGQNVGRRPMVSTERFIRQNTQSSGVIFLANLLGSHCWQR